MEIRKFKKPEHKYRPVPFWSWNDKLDEEELKRQIREMSEKGFGGYFCHSRVGLVTGYMSDEWIKLIKVCADEANRTDTSLWLYDEDKWPSGYAGGEVAKVEQYRGRSLIVVKDAYLTENDVVLAKHIYNGETMFICKRVLPLGDDWFGGTCYPDLMNLDAVKYFLECVHERYKQECVEYFGEEILGIFTDEPCYLMKTHYQDVKKYTGYALPWSESLPAYFRKLKNYSIEDHLIELFFNLGDYNKIRFDFYDAVTRLFLDSYTKQYHEWCNKNKLIMTGHYFAEDSLGGQLKSLGAVMPHYEYMDYPGIDKVAGDIRQHITCKQVSSVADQLKKKRTLCEVFAGMGQQTGFLERKWMIDWLAVWGINFFNYHLSLYSMRGERKRDYPPNLFYQQPWWDKESNFSEYVSRLSYVMSEGKRDVDILVIHPITTAWTIHSPFENCNEVNSKIWEYNNAFDSLSLDMLANKLDHHYGDEIIMKNHAQIKNGKLCIGQHFYSTVIIPPALNLRTNTYNLLIKFKLASKNNTLIIIKPSPQFIDGKKKSIKWPENTIICDTLKEAIDIMDKKYADRIKVINENTGNNLEKVLCHERIIDGEKVIFVANTDKNNYMDAVISVKSDRTPIVMDLVSGEFRKIPYRVHDGRIYIKLRFEPAGSLLLYFPESEIVCSPSELFIESGIKIIKQNNVLQKAEPYNVSICEENVLPINRVSLYLNDILVVKNEILAKVLHKYFYKAEEGTEFKAEYFFYVKNIPQREVFAVIEVAENLSNITLNGTEVKPLKFKGALGAFDKMKSWKDINFTKVPLDGLLRKGLNILTIHGKKINNILGEGYHSKVSDFKNHMPTELETVYIVGDFILRYENNNYYIDGDVLTPNPKDITSTGYPFYAGAIEVNYDLYLHNTIIENLYLRVNEVNAVCIELYINNEYMGLRYWKPYIFNVSNKLKKGNNIIKIKAYNTLFNLMGPNNYKDVLNTVLITPNTFTKFEKFTENPTIIPFGVGSIDILD